MQLRNGMLLMVFLVSILSAAFAEDAAPALKGNKAKGFPFYIYMDAMSKSNHFFPSGWMGDVGDIKFIDNYAVNPKSGKYSIQIKYTAQKKQNQGWTGIYWQNPANNWGNVKGGFDLTGAKSLQFYARGEKGGEIAEFKMGGISGNYPDSGVAASGPIELKKDWQLYKIDLKDIDLSYVCGGFCVTFSADNNPDGATFYLDEIVYSDK